MIPTPSNKPISTEAQGNVPKEERIFSERQTGRGCHMFRKIIAIAIIALGLLASSFGFGVGYGQKTFQPQVVTEYITITETVEVPVEVIKEIPVEVVRKVPTNLRYFKDTDELEKFLEESDADHHAYIKATKDGIIDLSLSTYDCEDYAIALRNHAHAKGFHMSIQTVWHYRRPDSGELVTRYYEGHALNSTIIGNEMYFIEPSTDDYWLAASLD